MGGVMLNKSLIQFSVEGRGCVPSLVFDLRPNSGGDNEDNGRPQPARKSNQSILKEISPEFSLEGLMLKLNLQYFGYLM